MAIVGGGITGALAGYLLTKAGVDCVLLDREGMGTGSTAASTGLLQYEVDTPLSELIRSVGESEAIHAYRRGLRAIDELESIASELDDSCGFERRQSLLLASSDADVGSLARECECQHQAGFDVHLLDAHALRETFGIAAKSALLTAGNGAVDPYRLAQALLRSAGSQGLRMFAQTAVTQIVESPLRATLHTPRARIAARAAIVCTGYAAGELLGSTPGELSTTYAVAGETPGDSAWPAGCLLWETARPYFYGRQAVAGHVIIGGEDTPGPFDHENSMLLRTKAAALIERLAQLLPAMTFAPTHCWAGTFAATQDSLPYIGCLPGRERIAAALAYGGNGITFGMIAARLLTDWYLQRPNADAAVFRFDR